MNSKKPGAPGSPKIRKFWKQGKERFGNVQVLEIVIIYLMMAQGSLELGQDTKCGKMLNSEEPGAPGSPKTRKFRKHCRGSFENVKVLESVIVYPISVCQSLELG